SPGHFLQGPGVAIGVAEKSVLDALSVFLYLADPNASTDERFACRPHIPDDQMQAPQRARWHGNIWQTGSNNDGARGLRWSELHNSDGLIGPDIQVGLKAHLDNVKRLGAVHICHRNRHQLQFHFHLASPLSAPSARSETPELSLAGCLV